MKSNPRRLILHAALTVALLGGLLALDVAPAHAVRAPKTLAHSAPIGVGPISAGFPVDYVAVTWDGEHGDAFVRLRHGGAWSAWIDMGEDGVQESGKFGTALVYAADADAYQVRVPGGARAARAVAINTTDGPLVTVGHQPASSATALDPIDYVLRSEWGANESLRFDAQGHEIFLKTYYPVQKLTVHHTATVNNDPNPAATVRAIYRYHAVDRTWGDIGYQFLVDEGGNVYEGRHTDDDVATPPGYRGTDGVTAAHAGGWNSGNIGIALLGTLTSQRASAAAQVGLERALADFANRSRIDPKGSGPYTNPVNGQVWNGFNIAGHRDFNATECPGDAMYPLLPEVRQNVADRLAGTPPPQDVTPPTITNVRAENIGTSAATIRWDTSGDPSTSQVRYWVRGTTTVKTTTLNSSLVVSHQVSLSGLKRRTTYDYNVISNDAAGNSSTSPNASFTTK